MSCASMLCKTELLSAVVRLLCITQTKISSHIAGTAATLNTDGSGTSSSTPRSDATHTANWLSPLLLLVDVWEKTLAQATWTRPPRKVHINPAFYYQVNPMLFLNTICDPLFKMVDS